MKCIRHYFENHTVALADLTLGSDIHIIIKKMSSNQCINKSLFFRSYIFEVLLTVYLQKWFRKWHMRHICGLSCSKIISQDVRAKKSKKNEMF